LLPSCLYCDMHAISFQIKLRINRKLSEICKIQLKIKCSILIDY
jgi:hypothetical protein